MSGKGLGNLIIKNTFAQPSFEPDGIFVAVHHKRVKMWIALKTFRQFCFCNVCCQAEKRFIFSRNDFGSVFRRSILNFFSGVVAKTSAKW